MVDTLSDGGMARRIRSRRRMLSRPDVQVRRAGQHQRGIVRQYALRLLIWKNSRSTINSRR